MAADTQLSTSQNMAMPAFTATSRIPLVSHIITDTDMGLTETSKGSIVHLSKIVKLLTDPHSCSLYDRHVHALGKVCKQFKNGFLMKDLVQVFKILNVCADRMDEQPVYEESMVNLLFICGAPFIKEKMSDELSYQQIVTESISQLGYLMRVASPDVRKQICKTLIKFYSASPSKQDQSKKHKVTNLSFNKRVVSESDVSETLVKSLALFDTEVDVKVEVLHVLQLFSQQSTECCNQMLRAEAALKICSHLMDADPTGEILFCSVELLWNLLELGERGMAREQLNNLPCINQLRDAFVFQITQGYSHYDRQLRNDLLVLTTLIAAICPDAPFIETGFAKQLILFATFQEVKTHNVLVKHLKFLQNHEDFELKKLLFNLLTMLCEDPSILPIMSEGHLLLALFHYVSVNNSSPKKQEWTGAQFEELQLQALDCLAKLCPLLLEDYVTCQGSTRMLLLLEWCVSQDTFSGEGNSFHGSGGRGNKRAQMRHCLRLLLSIVTLREEIILQDLVDQGAVSQLTTILRNACQSTIKDDMVDVEMQSDMLLILSSLCEDDLHRKELFGTPGVDVVVSYLKMPVDLIYKGQGHHRLLLSAVDCIWCAVVGCYITEDYFLEKEGVFLLMDLLESSPENMHNMIIGCLLDLSENSKTLQHLLMWRGKNNISTSHLLCDIWRREEAAIGVKRGPGGTIGDLEKPLLTSVQDELGVVPLPANCPSQSIVDVYENKRAKIYALFCKLGFVDLPGLNAEDHITLAVIESYLDFKLGEVWSELIGELDKEQVRPVTPDQEAVDMISRVIEEKTKIVVTTQSELQEAKQNQDMLDEQEFYADIRTNHRQAEKAQIDFADYVARTSNYPLLMAAKERQDQAIDASRSEDPHRDRKSIHSTDIPNLQSTTFPGRNVAIDSTPAHITGGPLAKYEPKTGTIRPRDHHP